MTTSLVARAPRLGGARALFTGRHGGVGRGRFGSANLAGHVGDDAETVARNRARLAESVGAAVVFVDQVHSAAVHVLPATGQPAVVAADAIVTDRTDVAPAVLVADCLPVLLSDAEAGVIGAAHAGRRGLLAGVLEATVTAMTQLGGQAGRLEAAVGPAICGACYEVPEQMREEAAAQLPAVRSTTRWSSPAIDLRAGAVEALERAGVPAGSIDAAHPCTLEHEEFFSYRRSATTGRGAGAIRRI